MGSVNQLPVSVIYKKEGNKLIPVADIDIIRENTFISSLKDGEKVEVTYQVIVDDGSYGQISKLHACIRQLALDTGSDFETMKLEVKRRAGLVIGDNFKSFADCSKEELSLAIQAAVEIGEFCGSNLNSY